MEITDNPTQEPGTCFICDATNHGGYVDTFKNFDYGPAPYMNGRKYVCRPCVVEMAVLFGFQPPEAVAVLKSDLSAAVAAKDEAELKLELQTTILKALERLSPPVVVPAGDITSPPPVPSMDGPSNDESSSTAVVDSPADRSPAPKRAGRPKKVVK